MYILLIFREILTHILENKYFLKFRSSRTIIKNFKISETKTKKVNFFLDFFQKSVRFTFLGTYECVDCIIFLMHIYIFSRCIYNRYFGANYDIESRFNSKILWELRWCVYRNKFASRFLYTREICAEIDGAFLWRSFWCQSSLLGSASAVTCSLHLVIVHSLAAQMNDRQKRACIFRAFLQSVID